MRFYPLLALLSLLLGLLVGALGYGEPYILPWYMFFTAIVASLYGLPWGLVAAGVSTLLLLLFPGFQAMGAAILLLSAYLAHGVGETLRRAHRRAKGLARSLRYLTLALEGLAGARNRTELLKSLPERLSELGAGGHVGVWVPEEEGFRLLASVPPLSLDRIPATGVVGRAYREERPLYIPDVRREEGYIAAPGLPSLSELALPLKERGQVVAVLNLERPGLFLEEEVEGLVRFAQAVSLELDQLADLEARRLLAELSERMESARSKGEAARKALALLVEVLGLESGALWEARGARMVALGHHGVTEPSLLKVLEEGLPYGVGLAWQVYETGSPVYTARYAEESRVVPALKALGWRTFVAHPVPTPGAPRTRRVLVLGQQAARPWRKAEEEMLLLACRTLGLALERLEEKERHERVNALFLRLLEKPPEALYHPLLAEAVALVPGAEAGSLLVLEGGAYVYKAALGYDLEALQAMRFSPEGMLLWYGLGEREARKGVPRVMSVEDRPIPEISHQTAPEEVIDAAGRALEIQANLCLPVTYQGEVLAYLNLDNLHDPRAFGEDSLEAARFFAAPLATLLHESHSRRLLEEAALTDPLTGLGNRRAFERAFQEELARAKRYGYPLALAVLDLRGFKPINDRLGHAMGDLALKRVAEALKRGRRNGDKVFRWGGDEFAVLFPHTPKGGAVAAAFRHAQAIGEICLEGHCLGVNIGVAAFPEDGDTEDALLSAADTRMYQAKAQGLSVVA
ncbi:diguanylate cyclase [Thermus oshimai]